MEQNKAIYHIDKIRINFKASKKELTNILPVDDLRRAALSCQCEKANEQAREWGYESKLEASVPSEHFFKILSQYEDYFTSAYSISYIEITKDSFCDSEQETLNILKRQLIPHLIKKYTSKCLVYDVDLMPHETKKKPDVSKYSDITGYWGSDNFQFVTYARLSKINQEPCVHVEWKLEGATIIKEKTGIKTTADILTYSADDGLEVWFSEQMKTYLRFATIDHKKHGRFIQNMRSRQTDPGSGGLGRKRLRKAKPLLASIIFCKIKGINTTAELIRFYKEERKGQDSNQSGHHRRGRKSLWQKKVQNLSNAKLNTFLDPYNCPSLQSYI